MQEIHTMMYIDNEVLEKMIMTIVEGFDRIEKKLDRMYNPQNEMFRLLGTKRSFSQNETFFFSHPYPALFRLISHF